MNFSDMPFYNLRDEELMANLKKRYVIDEDVASVAAVATPVGTAENYNNNNVTERNLTLPTYNATNATAATDITDVEAIK